MCVVSMVIQGAEAQWPQTNQLGLSEALQFAEIIRKLAELDAKLGAKDCIDAKKDEYIAALESRIAELQAAPKKKKKKGKK